MNQILALILAAGVTGQFVLTEVVKTDVQVPTQTVIIAATDTGQAFPGAAFVTEPLANKETIRLT